MRGFIVSAALALSTAPAAAQGPEPGLPIWVIRDADSTIYVTGTAHLLKPDVQWRSAKLDAALTQATEAWFEIAEVADPSALDPTMLVSSGPPLSHRLTAAEYAKLTEGAARAGLPESLVKAMDHFKPAAAILMLGIGGAVTNGGLGVGIDPQLAQTAKAKGDSIHGFETLGQQMAMIMGGTEEQQLTVLRAYLAAPPPAATSPETTARTLQAVQAWTNGRVEAMEALYDWMAAKAEKQPGGRAALAIILDERNDRWASQLQTLLAGKGVAFVAVGALHLVGSNSLFARLEQRGIHAERY